MSPAMLQTLPLDVLYQILSCLSPVSPPTLSEHPFLVLSQTSSALLRSTESFCFHLLTKFSGAHTLSTNRTSYLAHALEHCRFCNAPTTRHATIFPSIVACKECDLAHWPRRITLEYATKVYGINGRELVENCACGLIHRRWGCTWMFDEEEIEAYVRGIHGDLDVYLQRREDMWEREKMKAVQADPTLPVEERRRRGQELRGVFRELQELAVEGDEGD